VRFTEGGHDSPLGSRSISNESMPPARSGRRVRAKGEQLPPGLRSLQKLVKLA
jgi:hypothetical protein